jgi:hypothetical protein
MNPCLGSYRVSSLVAFSCFTMTQLKLLAITDAVNGAFRAIMALQLWIRLGGAC